MPSPCLLCRHHHRRRRHRYAPSSPTSSRRVILSRIVSFFPATVVVVVIVFPAIPRHHCQAGIAGRSQEAVRLLTVIRRVSSSREISRSSVSDASVVATLTSLTSSTRSLTIPEEQRLGYRYWFGNRRKKEGSTVAREGGGGGGGGERGDSPSRCTRCHIERNAAAPRATAETIGILGSNSSSSPPSIVTAKCCNSSSSRLDLASVSVLAPVSAPALTPVLAFARAPEHADCPRPRAGAPIGRRRHAGGYGGKTPGPTWWSASPRRCTVWVRRAPSTAAPRRFSRPICCS